MVKTSVRIWQYAGCGTCKKALAWLDANGTPYETIPIVEAPPKATVLADLVAASGLSARKFINVSGVSYRALVAERGKAAIDALSDEALIALLAADGKMIKRPLVAYGDVVIVGFDAARYAEVFGA